MCFWLDFVDVFDYAGVVAEPQNIALMLNYFLFSFIEFEFLYNFYGDLLFSGFLTTFIYNWEVSSPNSLLELVYIVDRTIFKVFEML